MKKEIKKQEKEPFKEKVLPGLVETKELFKLKEDYPDVSILTYMDLGSDLKDLYRENHNQIIASLRAIKFFKERGFEITYKGK